MRVTVRLFAGLRERAGWSTREIDADRVGEVWAELDLGEEPEGLLYAVNKEYAPVDRALADGDVVALIPPVSGGAFVLTEEPALARRGRRGGRDRGGRRDRHVLGHRAAPLARPGRRTTSTTRATRGWPRR